MRPHDHAGGPAASMWTRPGNARLAVQSFVSVGVAARRVSIVSKNICSCGTAGNVRFSDYATVTGPHLSVDLAEK
jgi:hypothetical protein